MLTYMNDKNLCSLTEEDLLFLVKAFADKHNEYEEQKKDIKDEIVSGINLILKYYNANM